MRLAMARGVLFVFDDAFRTGRGGHAGLFGERAADRLVFQGLIARGTGADETDVAAFADLGKCAFSERKP
jgi:hypothetical protein